MTACPRAPKTVTPPRRAGLDDGRAPGFPAAHARPLRRLELLAMEWSELKDGRIQRRWGARDSAAQARQLGWS